MSLQLLENKALSRGIIRKSAPLLAEITIRKSHPFEGSGQEAILLPHTTFDIFSVAFRSAYSTVGRPSWTHPCFHTRGVQTSSKHVGRICGVKAAHRNDGAYAIRGIEFVGVAPLS